MRNNIISHLHPLFFAIVALLALVALTEESQAQGLVFSIDSSHTIGLHQEVGQTASKYITVSNRSNVNATFQFAIDKPFTVDTTTYTLLPNERDSVLLQFESDTLGYFQDSMMVYSNLDTYLFYVYGEATDTNRTGRLFVTQTAGFGIMKNGEIDSVLFWIHNPDKYDITLDSVYRERVFADSTTYHNVNDSMVRVAGVEDTVFWYGPWPTKVKSHDSVSVMMWAKASKIAGPYSGDSYIMYRTPAGQPDRVWLSATYFDDEPDNCYTITGPATIGPVAVGDTVYDTIYVHNQTSETRTFTASTFENDIRPVWRFLNSWPQTVPGYTTAAFVFRYAPIAGIQPGEAIGNVDQYNDLFIPYGELTPDCDLYTWYMRLIKPSDQIPVVEKNPPSIALHRGVDKVLRFYNDLAKPIAFTNIGLTNAAYTIVSTTLPLSGKLLPAEQFNVVVRTDDPSATAELHLITQTELITLAKLSAASAGVADSKATSMTLRITPNPASEHLQVAANGISIASAELLDALGRVVASRGSESVEAVRPQGSIWSIERKTLGLSSGAYYVRVTGFAEGGKPVTLTQRVILE